MNLNSVLGALPPPARCPHCGAPYSLTRPEIAAPGPTDTVPTWQGCPLCLANELRQLRDNVYRWYQALPVLVAARRALTQPVAGDDIDAICAAIDALVPPLKPGKDRSA